MRKGNSLSVSGVDAEYLDVPFVYYLGYAAEDENGKILKTDGSGFNGRVRVWPDSGRNVKVFYKGTILQKVSDIISILTIVVISGGWLFVSKMKRK